MRMILLALLLTLPALSVLAADAEAPIDGKWIDRNPSGNGMLVEFTAKTVTTTPIDAKGAPTDQGVTEDVTYTSSKGAITATLPRGDIMVAAFKDKDTIFLVIPGLPTTEYARVK